MIILELPINWPKTVWVEEKQTLSTNAVMSAKLRRVSEFILTLLLGSENLGRFVTDGGELAASASDLIATRARTWLDMMASPYEQTGIRL
jgi:hypothetical protein